MTRFFFALFFAANLAVSSAPAFAAESSPRLLVHLLDYVGMDYPGAVSQGKVTHPSEYQEQMEFIGNALDLSQSLPEIKSDQEIQRKIRELKNVIEAKGPAERVAALSSEIKNRVIQVGKVQMTPKQWPDLKRGGELFAQACASCHGANGMGDGPAGVHLDPKPANFMDEEKGGELPPFRAFNAIRVGIPGTGMAPFPFPDEQVWDLAFYVVSLRHQAKVAAGSKLPALESPSAELLTLAASHSDRELLDAAKPLLPGKSESERNDAVMALRLHSGDDSTGGSSGSGSGGSEAEASSLNTAKDHLNQALSAYRAGDFDLAKKNALIAYLQGVEPVEPMLKAKDSEFMVELEGKMAAVRATIEARKDASELERAHQTALEAIARAESIVKQKDTSAWLTFAMTAGIFLREGFEAVLILIALLVVVRASGSKKGENYIHAGWIAACAVGVVAWIFSGWLLKMSGADREMLEALVSLLAVGVLLYIGFWLHSKTEITRWKHFIEGRVKTALEGHKLYGLAAISFMAVFREVFESVLFLRAIDLEGGASNSQAMAVGVIVSFVAIIALSSALLKYSARVPIRKLFAISSALMGILALILTGKGVHALQETGVLGVTSLPFGLGNLELIGLFPTRETLLPQLGVLVLLWLLWVWGKRPPAAGNAT